MKRVFCDAETGFAKTPASLSAFQHSDTFSSEIQEIFTLDVKQWTNLETNVFTVKVI
jgi:hypothetical protein